MRLLKIKDNKPFKDRNSNVEFLRDWCCLFINEQLEWEFYLNEEIAKGETMSSLQAILKNLIKEKELHHKSDKNERRLVIWTNKLSILSTYIRLLNQNLIPTQIDKFNKGKEVHIVDKIYNTDLEFRNFDLIAGEDIIEVKKTYGFKSKGVNIMVDFLKKKEEQGLNGWSQIRYTFSNNNLKLFYKRFNNEEIQQMRIENLKRIPTLEFHQIIQEAGKQGIMLCNPNIINQLIDNVYSFDISSAYNSQFIRGDDFPIGKVKRAAASELPQLIKENKWFLIVMYSEFEVDNLFNWIKPVIKDDGYYYIIGNYDYKIIQETGGSLKRIDKNWKIYKVFKCDEQGYLNYRFREELVNLYETRQALKSMGKTEEKIYKQVAEVLYGKGIQKRKFETNSEIHNFYSKRDNTYIGCQISYHALQRTRYEIMKMMLRLNYSYIACDTDSIKTQSPMAPLLFKERNEEILEENRKAGFPNTRIGLWKFEGLYPHFIQYGNKVYAFENNNKIECKFAGCLKEASSIFFKNLSLEEGIRQLQNPELSIPEGVIKKFLALENNQLILKKVSYSYKVRGGDCDEMD